MDSFADPRIFIWPKIPLLFLTFQLTYMWGLHVSFFFSLRPPPTSSPPRVARLRSPLATGSLLPSGELLPPRKNPSAAWPHAGRPPPRPRAGLPTPRTVRRAQPRARRHAARAVRRRRGRPRPAPEEQLFIFNGDYIDRGAWELETLLLLLAWKVRFCRFNSFLSLMSTQHMGVSISFSSVGSTELASDFRFFIGAASSPS